VNWDAHTNLATSMVYLHPETGEKSVVAHNPRPDAITVKIFEQMQEVGSLEVPGGALVLHKY
jgi:hypothetical protein